MCRPVRTTRNRTASWSIGTAASNESAFDRLQSVHLRKHVARWLSTKVIFAERDRTKRHVLIDSRRDRRRERLRDKLRQVTTEDDLGGGWGNAEEQPERRPRGQDRRAGGRLSKGCRPLSSSRLASMRKTYSVGGRDSSARCYPFTR